MLLKLFTALGFVMAPSLALAVDYHPIHIQVLRVTPLGEEIKFESGSGEKFKPIGSKTGVYDVSSLKDYMSRVQRGELRYPRGLTKPIEFGMKVGGWCAGLLGAGVLFNSIHHLPGWIDNLAYVLAPPAVASLVYSTTRTKDRDTQRRHAETLQTVLDGRISADAAEMDQLIQRLERALKVYQVFIKRTPAEGVAT